MGTRSIIAKVDGDGFIGRYCHWDGYPSHMLPELVHVLTHHDGGPVAALEVLLAHDWSSISHEKCELGEWDDPSRGFAPVPGVGIAHDEGGPTWLEYHGEAGGMNTDCEWVYAIDAERGRITVFDLPYASGTDFTTTPRYVGAVNLSDDLTDEMISRLECGENYERCSHCAYVHFPEAEGTRLGTAQWLGREPMDFHDVIAFTYKRKTYTLSGSGGRRSKGGGRYTPGNARDCNEWWVSVKESEKDLPLAVYDAEDNATPYPGVKWIFPSIPAVV